MSGSKKAMNAERPPNVVLVITDDQGFGDVRSHGNDRIDTPVLDDLAEQGVRFGRFYVSPVCAPTRAALLTGRYHPRTGALATTANLETMHAEEVTIAQALRPAGYATGCFGKWHNGAYYPHTPRGKGFDEFLGFRGGFFPNYFDPILDDHHGEKVQTRGFITDVLADAAMEFIDKHCNQPFFCYVPFNAPHSPLQCPDDLFEKYKKRGLDDYNACIYSECENVDRNVGRILNKLGELALADNTIVLFLSDNGANISRLYPKRYNARMRGWKGSIHEGGNRVPLFMRWPSHLQPGTTIETIAAHIDLLPTIIEMCGVPMPETLPLDGRSLVPLLKGGADHWPERMIFTHLLSRLAQFQDGKVPLEPGAVRTSRYRLAVYPDHRELYDMIADPSETEDLADGLLDVARKLRGAYDTWFDDVTPEDHRIEKIPIPIGHKEANPVELPAQYCAFHGGVGFAGHGWDYDWATRWESIDDYVDWDIDVARSGRYEVTLQYTCPQEDVGAKIRVEVGGRVIEGVVTRAHDPAEILRPDRVPRWEQNEKVWASLTLGTVDLARGRTALQVRAVEIPGEAAMDLRAALVRRIE